MVGQHIDHFCEELRVKLTRIDDGLDSLKTKINRKAQDAEQVVRDHLDEVEKRIDSGRPKVEAAQSEVKNWVDERKTLTRDKVAEWKTKRETNKLHNRADRAERYAAAASEIAGAAVDEAERAALESWLARQDAICAQVKQAIRP
jgi:predicted  nucleic acid-binding Zn-ribbon protein